jgi:uncharacterized integral membrane protein
MQFLKGLFWFLLAVLIAVFSIGNWITVPIKLWGGLIADVNLPLLLVVVFLAGFVPVMLWQTASKWRLRQKLSAAERTIAELRVPIVVPHPPIVQPGDTPGETVVVPAMLPSPGTQTLL